MTRLICVTSGKGGVGKTTLVANLSAALAKLGNRVIAVDANLTTPNLGLHLGMHLAPRTLHHVLRGEVKLADAIYPHEYGFQVLPASISVHELHDVDPSKLASAVLNLYGKADFVLLDSAAGLGREALSAMQAAEELMIVANPELTSVTDALKTVKIAEKLGKPVTGVVLNRVRNHWHELLPSDVVEMTGHPIIASIPEDRSVQKAVMLKMPVINFDPNSDAAIEINRLAHHLTGLQFTYKKRQSLNLIQRIARWLSI
jgi:septum site-determining protein MinD